MSKAKTGTHVRFWPDRQIFTKDAQFEWEGLIGRARWTSFIVPGLELVIRDLRGSQPVEEKFRHDGGISEFTEFLAHDRPEGWSLFLSVSFSRARHLPPTRR